MYCECCDRQVPTEGWNIHINGKMHKAREKLQNTQNLEIENVQQALTVGKRKSKKLTTRHCNKALTVGKRKSKKRTTIFNKSKTS